MYDRENESNLIAGPENAKSAEMSGLTEKIASYLRWTGSLLVIVSAISFMIQGNVGLLPAYRYWVGLAFTLMLCGGGMICAYLFKETKGARIFFGLATVFVTVQVSQAAAMVYGYMNGEAASQPAYAWLRFMDVSPATIAVDFALTAVLLLLVGYAGFSILARRHRALLLGAYVAGNAVLMLPVRDLYWTPLMLGAMIAGLRILEQKLRCDSVMQLPEGMAARVMIWLPASILLGRSLLHPVSFAMAVVILCAAAVLLTHDIRDYVQSKFALYVCQWLGTISAVAAWMIVADRVSADSVDNALAYLLPVSVILFALSEKVEFHARLYRAIASVWAMLVTYAALQDQQYLAPVFALATGMALCIAGLKCREKIPFFGGNFCFAGGLLFYFQYAIEFYEAAPWVSSIALGLAVLLLASYIENKQQQI
ncbi:MAG: hypothetical protein ACU826_11545, partial [Gammaproteobacteria bacterium]